MPAALRALNRGIFITFEGAEGCGKSTQVRLLAARLRALGHRVSELREPGGTPLGEEIRHTLKHSAAGAGMSAEAELLLMNAARAELVRKVIRPALDAGGVVVCDRFHDSTVAYQGWGRGLDPARVAEVVGLAVGTTRPDLTLWLRVPPEVGAERRAQRSAGVAGAGVGVVDRFEAEPADFFRRVEAGFAAVAAAEPGRVKPVDAAPGVEEVERRIWQEVVARWPSWAGADGGAKKGVK